MTFSMNAYPVNPPWCEDVQNFYGYNVITAVNASYLTWVSYNTNQNDDEAIMDRIVVTQNVTNLGLDGWVLPASTEECITLQNAGPSAKKPFIRDYCILCRNWFVKCPRCDGYASLPLQDT